MNRRHLFGAAIAALSLASHALYADHDGNGARRGPSPAQQLERLTEHLGLDSNQAASIEVILQQAAEARTAIGDRYTLNQRDEAAEALKSLRESTRTQIAELLTPEQLETFETAMNERERRRQFRRLHRRAHAEQEGDS